MGSFGNLCERLKLIYLADVARFFFGIFLLLKFRGTLFVCLYIPRINQLSLSSYFGVLGD
jgi:hypothetical protein